MSNLARTTRRDTHEIMADIFNSLDRKTESQFMAALEERNQESAERIRQLMFTFDDLLRINSTGIQSILRLVPKEQLALGLKGASQEVRTLFFENMSERAGKMMREDMEAMGPVRLRDVDEAQAAIVAAAKTLADSGEIVIAGNDGEGQEEMVI
jgi:flagellar motor switch protein FliG